jgi:hypothetical protein
MEKNLENDPVAAARREFVRSEMPLAIALVVQCATVHGCAEMAGSAAPWLPSRSVASDPLGSIGKYLAEVALVESPVLAQLPVFFQRLAVVDPGHEENAAKAAEFVATVGKWRWKEAGERGENVFLSARSGAALTRVLAGLIDEAVTTPTN